MSLMSEYIRLMRQFPFVSHSLFQAFCTVSLLFMLPHCSPCFQRILFTLYFISNLRLYFLYLTLDVYSSTVGC